MNDNTFSDWRYDPAGVPPGRKLGSWLFILMVNDLSLDGNVKLWEYIDDTTLSETIVRGFPSSIQSAVDEIQSLAAANHFHLHPILNQRN